MMRSTTAEADIAATPAEVWAALTSPAQTRQYFAGLRITSAWRPDADVDAHYGATLIATGTVVVADKASDLIYRLDEPATGDIDCWLSWHLDEPATSITRVTLTADTLPSDPPVDVIRLLGNFKTHLEKARRRSCRSQAPRAGQPAAAPASDRGEHPTDFLETTMSEAACPPTSDPGIAEPEWLPAGHNLRDVALQLPLLLNGGFSLAIATTVGTHGTLLRQPGTVLVISESGQTIGFNPAGPHLPLRRAS